MTEHLGQMSHIWREKEFLIAMGPDRKVAKFVLSSTPVYDEGWPWQQ
jgi:hypothetical protein